MDTSLSSNEPRGESLGGLALKNEAGEGCPRRLCLRNAFEQVYPHGG